ncbi:complex I NDUFA9 subunit family protein [Donghicola mangrovi]|uniref:Complex I NDUFA9 subunit family protein n=1 Tax=Donghicola mangrovi TaxID=2729614 RepID=A0A850PZJ6_9RHOB|nr:complex I NDUFA9 subunit family protein [Donghicola mangrovi]NVO22213.1 complex I NDUFA9 subunit family protein [Donghicola mangrovi]
MAQLVTIFGGSGFVGRYVARRLAQQGYRVRVAVRRPNEAGFVRTYGVVGQVEPVLCNIRDDASVQAAVAGADAVVNCVGILAETGKNRFEAVQAAGAERVARAAAAAGITRMVQISALGADANSPSEYARTKAAGEAAVLAHVPGAVILRPSIIFGNEDGFFNRFAGMMGPILPVVGANTKFQPVYVDDVAAAAVKAVNGDAPAGIYELGGPDVRTFRELMQDTLAVIHRRKLILNVPFFAASIMGGVLDMVQGLTLGLFTNGVLTKDQVQNLKSDNVVSEGAAGFEAFGIVPTNYHAVLPSYLWKFRPSGQYDAIKASAKNLRG